MKPIKKDDIITVLRGQFRVWHGTENADDILGDTARAIGYQVFNLKGGDLDRFETKCRTSSLRGIRGQQ